MIVNNPKYNSLPEQVEQNRKDIQQIKDSHLVDVDDELSTQSTNPVQNKVITEALETEEFERKQDVEDLDTTKQNKNDNTLETTDKTIVGGINELNTNKQNKNDDTLETTNKTIVGAINELNSNKQDNLTEAQQDAVNSGIDSTKVAQIETNKNNITALSPTTIGMGTPNSTYINTGDCYYVKIGKIVFVQLNNVRFNAVTQNPDDTLFSGLPKNVGDWTTIVSTSWSANQTVRMFIDHNSTELKNYWSGFTPSSSDHSFTGMCMYLTE